MPATRSGEWKEAALYAVVGTVVAGAICAMHAVAFVWVYRLTQFFGWL